MLAVCSTEDWAGNEDLTNGSAFRIRFFFNFAVCEVFIPLIIFHPKSIRHHDNRKAVVERHN